MRKIALIVVSIMLTGSFCYAMNDESIDPNLSENWSTFSYGFGFYADDYSIETDETNYNHVNLNLIGLVSVGGKRSYYSPVLLPAEYYTYDKDGLGTIEKVYLLPIIEGGISQVISEDIFEVDDTGKEPWGNDGVDHYYFIDEEKRQIGYSKTAKAYIGNNKVTELQELPWPRYYSDRRRIILYPVSEEKAKSFRVYETEEYIAPDFYVLPTGPFEDYEPLLERESVLSSADTWAQNEIEEAIRSGIETDRMTKQNYKTETTRAEFAELVMVFYDKLGGKNVIPSDSPFSDTSDEAILKANKAGIVNGTGDGSFNPSGEITREELCVMIIRGLKNAGININESTEFIKSYEDQLNISSWALSSMATLNQEGIYKGDNINLTPHNTVDKQTAVILLYRAYQQFK